MHSNSQNNSVLLSIIVKKEECNKLTQTFDGVGDVFQNVNILIPHSEYPELFFIKTVSWLYVLYFEAGKIAIKFLQSLFDTFSLDNENVIRNHPAIVNALRTELQHNLQYEKQHDRKLMETCRKWFDSSCGTSLPGSKVQWGQSLEVLLDEALIFMEAIVECIRKIENDEFRINILTDWVLRINRHHAPHEFDAIISIVASDMGRPFIDPIKFREKFYSEWIQYLTKLDDGYDFQSEVRRLVEFSMLEKGAQVLPISGKDIIEEFGIKPGPKVGELLGRAKTLWIEEKCNREGLLKLVRNEIDQPNSNVTNAEKS